MNTLSLFRFLAEIPTISIIDHKKSEFTL